MSKGKLLFEYGRFSVWYYPGVVSDWELGYRSLKLGKLWFYW